MLIHTKDTYSCLDFRIEHLVSVKTEGRDYSITTSGVPHIFVPDPDLYLLSVNLTVQLVPNIVAVWAWIKTKHMYNNNIRLGESNTHARDIYMTRKIETVL